MVTQHAALAAKHLHDCTLCPHLCGTARAEGEGVCRVAQDTYIASEMMHRGEEALLNPAQAIFFSGCTATCRFCTAAKFAFRPTYGVQITPAQLAERMRLRQSQGARSICFIGGDPAPHIPFILDALECFGAERTIPTVLNSNFYLTHTALELLDGSIDIYLPDFKFGPQRGAQSCGERIGGMPDYWTHVVGCMERLYGEGKRLIVRHLLMPGHYECCTLPIFEWLSEHPNLDVSLLTQYLAPSFATDELAETLSQSEIDTATAKAEALGLSLIN